MLQTVNNFDSYQLTNYLNVKEFLKPFLTQKNYKCNFKKITNQQQSQSSLSVPFIDET